MHFLQKRSTSPQGYALVYAQLESVSIFTLYICTYSYVNAFHDVKGLSFLMALHLALPPCGLSGTVFLIGLRGFISFLTAAKYSIQWMYHQVLQRATDPSYQELSF